MKKLQFYPASTVGELAWPDETENLSLETPALNFFTDFNDIKPLVIESSVSASDVSNIMRKAHVKLKFVVDQENNFLGVVSSEDVDDRKIVQKISDGFARDEIMVTDMMRPKQSLVALSFHELSTASIGDVIDTLRDSGNQHCLVVDKDTNRIRGIFSASDIARLLHLSIDIHDKSDFYKVFSATEK